MNLLKYLLGNARRRGTLSKSPAGAYDLLAPSYDSSAGNLMIALDEMIVPELMQTVPVARKVVLDFGCGTGRYWPYLMSLHPDRLSGYDASEGMLHLLKEKYPGADAQLVTDYRLLHTEAISTDLIISTLTIHYLQDLEQTFGEWNRVLKPGGIVVITGYHPDSLQHDGVIRFSHPSGTIAVRHNQYSLSSIREIAHRQGWIEAAFVERRVDEEVRHFYEEKNALRAYELAKGKPIIYGMRFRKEISLHA